MAVVRIQVIRVALECSTWVDLVCVIWSHWHPKFVWGLFAWDSNYDTSHVNHFRGVARTLWLMMQVSKMSTTHIPSLLDSWSTFESLVLLNPLLKAWYCWSIRLMCMTCQLARGIWGHAPKILLLMRSFLVQSWDTWSHSQIPGDIVWRKVKLLASLESWGRLYICHFMLSLLLCSGSLLL